MGFKSAFSSYFNLTIAAAGAGLLAYPFACQQQGIVLCIILTLVFALINVFTDFVIVETGRLFRDHLSDGNFDTLIHFAVGPRLARWASSSIVIGSFGALVGYLIVVGDLASGPMLEHLGCPEIGGVGCFFASRGFVIPFVAFVVTLPLSLIKKVESLGHSSVLATLTVLAVCFIVAFKGVERISQGGLITVVSSTAQSSHDEPDEVILFRWSRSIFLGIPISIFSLGNHMQILPIYLGHAEGSWEDKVFPRVVQASVSTCLVIYLTTGVLGYASFTTTTASDVMKNLPNDAATIAGKVLLAIHLLLAFPILFYPAKSTLLMAAGAAEGPSIFGRVCGYASKSAVVVPVVVTGFASLLAVSAPQVSLVFGLLGATVATFQIYTCPGLLLLNWSRALGGDSKFLSLEGLPLGSLERLRAERWGLARVSSITGEGEDMKPLLSGGENGVATAPLSRSPVGSLLFFSSPGALRAFGYFLLAMSFVVCLIGTGTYIESTWGGG